jgi:hypothetical protein
VIGLATPDSLIEKFDLLNSAKTLFRITSSRGILLAIA